MNVVFLGTPPPAVTALEALLEAGHRVKLVVTQPDRAAGRSRTPRPTPAKRCALSHGIPVLQPRRVRTAGFADSLREHAPDALVVVAYGRILPPAVLELAPRGAVNVHFSLLPRYRGAAPVQWALARGERVTGVTTMRIAEELDAGDVLLQQELAIEPGEHAPALGARLAAAGAGLLIETLERMLAGSLTPLPQDPHAATFAPRLTPQDGVADLGLPAIELEGRIRGFDPWPGVWARRGGRRLRLVDGAAVPGETSLPPGRVETLEDDALLVACGGATRLAVRSIQPEGRRTLSARDAVNGRLLVPGQTLE